MPVVDLHWLPCCICYVVWVCGVCGLSRRQQKFTLVPIMVGGLSSDG